MKHYPTEQSDKECEEKECVDCFLSWRSHRCGVKYTFERTEEFFPKLADGTRWDFVAIPHDNSNRWCALEVKRLIRPQTRIQLVRWNKILKNVVRSLIGQLQGEFLVVGVPHLKLDQKARTQLRGIIRGVILKNARTMKVNEKLDLGLQIGAQFPWWPSVPHLEMVPAPHIEYKVRVDSCFTIIKLSDSGCSIELGASPPDVFYIIDAVTEAIGALFDPTPDGIFQANEQLALAKAKRAKRTVLLLDCRLTWRPNIVKEILGARNRGLMSNIDVIYLVKASQKRVKKVWSSLDISHPLNNQPDCHI